MDLSRINAILYDEWDPIGVKGFAPSDEYKAYAEQILKILDDGGDHKDILGLLSRTRIQEMMLEGDDQGDGAIAKLIEDCYRSRNVATHKRYLNGPEDVAS